MIFVAIFSLVAAMPRWEFHGALSLCCCMPRLGVLHRAKPFVRGDLAVDLRDENGLALCELRHARSVIQILTSRRREARLWRRRWLA